MPEPNDYVGIRVWEKFMGSKAYYLETQLKHAVEDGAPIDAIYQDGTGVWRRIEDLSPTHEIRGEYEKALRIHEDTKE